MSKEKRKSGKSGKPATKASRKAERARAEYEAAKTTRTHVVHRTRRSSNDMVQAGAAALRDQARHLERNHDLARGIIRTMVNNIVGPAGIGIEPQPRRRDGSIHTEYAAALRDAYRDWQRRPEVTWTFNWSACQRMSARTWLRDGEMFAQMLIGKVPYLDHGTRIPFSLELFEADRVPIDFDDKAANIRQGIQTNAWGRKTGAWVFKGDPADAPVLLSRADLKYIPGDNLLHLMRVDRIGQLRGVSELASVLTRLDDIKDYEESERIAAKLAARLTMYVRKGNGEQYNDNDAPRDEEGNILPREIELQAGTIIDDLGPGEEIGVIDSKRPNPNAIVWRMGQLRAAAAGAGASYSSIARDYDGTYSAQRQEMVEQWVHYAVLTDEFTSLLVQPVWERFVLAAHLSGVVPMPSDVNPDSADDALYVAQSMPWIDPLKEATAFQMLVQNGFASEVEVLRRRGLNPVDTIEQIANFRELCAKKGLVFLSNAAHSTATTTPPPEDPPPDPAARTRKRGA